MRLRSAAWVFSSQVASIALAMPVSILLARVLGPEGKGVLSVVQQIAVVGAAVLNVGLGPAFTFRAAKREVHGPYAVGLSLTLSLAAAAVLLSVFVVTRARIGPALLPEEPFVLLALGALAVGPVIFSQVMSGLLVGAGSVRTSSLVSVGSLAVQLAGFVCLALVGALTPGSAIAVWILAVSGAAVAMGALGYRVRAAGVLDGAAALLRRIWRFGLAAWASNGLGQIALRVDVFMVAYFIDATAVGVYSIAVTVAELLWVLPGALNAVLVPKVAGAADTDVEVATRLSRSLWPVAACSGLALWALSVPVIPLLFGEDFRGAIVPLGLLLPGAVAIAVASMASAYLYGIGHPGDWTKASATNVVVNLGANIVLIPVMGIGGAALASSISYSVAAAMVVRSFVRRSGKSWSDTLVPRPREIGELGHAMWLVLRERSRGQGVSGSGS